MASSCPHDPFQSLRTRNAVLPVDFAGEQIHMILRHKEVRAAAKDWQNFSSDAPFRVPIPSEEKVRSVRQLPIETDPPDHTRYRKLIEPTFRKPLQPEFAATIDSLIGSMLESALAMQSIEVVRDFSLPLQSRALAHLLGVSQAEADRWIQWGVHVFHDGPDSALKGSELDRYIHDRFDQAEANPGDDFFSELCHADCGGRRLTRDEMAGFANLVFAGGRDTVIHTISHTISHIIAYFGENPRALDQLRDHPGWLATAAEEFVRVLSPLTHIGRVCRQDATLDGHEIQAGQRISLCWASANHDPSAFDAPHEVRLDRRPNPHVAYGSGPHNCIGAAHARLIVKSLLRQLSQQVSCIQILEACPNLETGSAFSRQIAFDRLSVRFLPRPL